MNQERTATGAGVNVDAAAAHQLDPTVDGKDPAGGDAIRTIYICNLPVDVQYREIWNLCRFLPGFLRCSVFVNNKMVRFCGLRVALIVRPAKWPSV